MSIRVKNEFDARQAQRIKILSSMLSSFGDTYQGAAKDTDEHLHGILSALRNRDEGPAALSGQTRFLWVYLLAPMLGAMLATWVRETVQRHRSLLTHRLCGTHRDGSSLSSCRDPFAEEPEF